jgi:hypothetical protein
MVLQLRNWQFVLFVLLIATCSYAQSSVSSYNQSRALLVSREAQQSVGASLGPLSAQESALQSALDALRDAIDPSLAAHTNFRYLMPMVENSTLFRVLTAMPKGALLHAHSIHSAMEALRVGTYKLSCLVCMDADLCGAKLYGHFRYGDDVGGGWVSTVAARGKSNDTALFDMVLYNFTQFYTPTYAEMDETTMWIYFNGAIGRGADVRLFITT